MTSCEKFFHLDTYSRPITWTTFRGVFIGLLFIINTKKPVPTKMDIFPKKHQMFVNPHKVKHHNSGN